MPWKSSATSTSSTGQSSIACSPTGRPQRPSATHRYRSRRLLGRDVRASSRDRRDARREDRRAARHRLDSRSGEAAREVPPRPDRDDAAPRTGAQARPAGALRARRRLAGEAARGGTSPAPANRARAWSEARGERAGGARFGGGRTGSAADTAATRARNRKLARRRPGRARRRGHPRAPRRLGAPMGRQRQGHRPDRRHHAPDHARQEPCADSTSSRASARPASRGQGDAPTPA